MLANPLTNLDVKKIREDFPLLQCEMNGRPLVYFDNAATSQKPRAVINALKQYYETENANVMRGVHALSAIATEKFEAAREQVRRFIQAKSSKECIFVRGTTEGINLVAHSFVEPRVKAGDEILITYMEHHSNIVPWQLVCKNTGATLVAAPVTPEGRVDLDAFEKLITPKTKFVAITHTSNALGTINPVKTMIEMAHAKGAPVLVDGAQAVPHFAVDVGDLGCDFYAFSGHKMFGPTGIGVLWGKEELLEAMIPYQGGGEMITYVTMEATEYAPLPHKFEAGTPNIAGVIGLGAALEYLNSLDLQALHAYEAYLLHYATEAVNALPGFKIIGTAEPKVPVISLVHETVHAHDLGTILDSEGIAIRTGHHCAMPLMNFYGLSATSRMSMAFYNTVDEIDRCIAALMRAREVFA